jgi:subtilisin-like proprotein convertase family protein
MKKLVLVALSFLPLVLFANMRIPGAPSNLVAVAKGPNSVQLTWTDNSLNELGFSIERGLDGKTFKKIIDIESSGSDNTIYVDEGVLDNTRYFYRISAFDESGSLSSNIVDLKTPRAYFSLSGLVVDAWDFSALAGAKVSIVTQTVSEKTLSAAIPDVNLTGVEYVLDVEESFPIQSLKVAIKITHSYPNELKIDLIHPDGTTAKLHNKTSVPVADLSYPDKDTPSESLNIFDGKPMVGKWKIRVVDTVSGGAGTINLGKLTFLNNIGTATTDENGAYRFRNLPSGVMRVAAEINGFTFSPSVRELDLRKNTNYFNFIGNH